MFVSEWREFHSAPCLEGGKKYLMTARVSMLLKSRASLTRFRACFLPGRAKDLSAPHVFSVSDRPVCRLRSITDGHLQRILYHMFVLIQFNLLMMSTELLETCGGL